MEVPFKASFEEAKSYDKAANIVLWISTCILVIAFVLQSISKELQPISELINAINCFFIVGFAVLEFVTNYFFFEASTQKRNDFVDNSFETAYAEENTSNYFTNDNVEKGMYKMAVNGFENSLFTYNIAKRMLKSLWMKNAIIAILFILLAVLGFNSAFVMLLQLTLPLLLIYQALKHTLFVTRIKRIFEGYRRLFQDLKDSNEKESKYPEMLLHVIEYESTLSWGSILLDSKIYDSLNPELSVKWDQIKLRYNIR